MVCGRIKCQEIPIIAIQLIPVPHPKMTEYVSN